MKVLCILMVLMCSPFALANTNSVGVMADRVTGVITSPVALEERLQDAGSTNFTLVTLGDGEYPGPRALHTEHFRWNVEADRFELDTNIIEGAALGATAVQAESDPIATSNLTAHIDLTGTNVHGLGTMATETAADYPTLAGDNVFTGSKNEMRGDFQVINTNAVIVSGFGDEQFNGIYLWSGVQYEKDGGAYIVFASSTEWNITDNNTGDAHYISADNPRPDYPYLVETWNATIFAIDQTTGTVEAQTTLSATGSLVRVHTDLQVDGDITAANLGTMATETAADYLTLSGGAMTGAISAGGQTSVDPVNRLLHASTSAATVDWDLQELLTDGQTQLSWAARAMYGSWTLGGNPIATTAATITPTYITWAETVNLSLANGLSQAITNAASSAITVTWPAAAWATESAISFTMPPVTTNYVGTFSTANGTTFEYISPLVDGPSITNATSALGFNRAGSTNWTVRVTEIAQ